MKKHFPFFVITLLMISLLIMAGGQTVSVRAQDVLSPAPTYDPLEEPFLPENPSDYELGQNWYWHHCMPCHGDKGQGLTDEFRAIWPEDHQDCWGYGCHAGERIEDSFAIPTVVPPIVSNAKLARFSSLQLLYEYLKATHPPQYPGHLSDEQYHAIALYIFTLNDRSLVENTPTTPASTSTSPSKPVNADDSETSINWILFFGLGIILLIAIVWIVQKRFSGRVKQSNP